jgi:endonuclease YncB( thermonuclease family)
VATAAAAITLAALALSACSSAEDSKPDDAATATDGGSASESSKPGGVVVDITFDGDTVTPNGERIDGKVGEPITLNIDADAPGELHVHSTPEQEIAYDAGTSTHEVTFDQPGIVDIESHHLEKVVVQVEVR